MLKKGIDGADFSHSSKKLPGLVNAVKNNPGNREPYIELAVELASINRIDQAIRFFNRANAISEDYLSLYNTGSLYYKKGDFKNAIITLEKAKLLNNRFQMIYLLTGLCYGRLKNYKASESNFINVIMNDPDNTTALTALAILYHNQGKIDESLKLIGRISGSRVSSGSIRKIKSEILFNSGKADESAEEIKEFKNSSEKFRGFNDFIQSIPVAVLTDKYGSIEEKIQKLETDQLQTKDNLISLSLCHLFSGNTDSAIDYLIAARKRVAV